MQNKDTEIFTGYEVLEKKPSGNENLMQIKSNYVAAMMVPKPRNLKLVTESIMQEAEEAKDDFYYSWLVNNRKMNRKDLIEGGTIGLAQCIGRNWTNCAIETEVKEFGGEWIFKTTFVDFEKGFTTTRELRLMIPRREKDQKDYDYERSRNMKFQIGQSKNQRDCIFNAVPRWLKKQALNTAKNASRKEASQNTDIKLKKALDSFAEKGITEQDLLGYFGKSSIKDFDVKIVAQLRNLWVQLDNGEVSIDAIKEQAKDVFDRSHKKDKRKQCDKTKEQKKAIKESNKNIQDVKCNPHSEMGKAPTKEAIMRADLDKIIKSFDMHGIDELEICAYYGVDDIEELNCEMGLSELRSAISDIESKNGNLTPEQFKQEGAERVRSRFINKENNKKSLL